MISLFTIPTVISGHGNGGLLRDQGSSDAPSDSTLENKHSPAVGARPVLLEGT